MVRRWMQDVPILSYCACCGRVLGSDEPGPRCPTCMPHAVGLCNWCALECERIVVCATCGRHPHSPGARRCGVCNLYGRR